MGNINKIYIYGIFCYEECMGRQLSTIQDYAGRYLVGTLDGTMQARHATRSIQSQFQIIQIDEKVAFRNVLGKLLAAEENDLAFNWNRDEATAGEWTRYTMEREGDKTAFKTAHNDYISVTEEGAVTRASTVGPQELFEIVDMCKIGISGDSSRKYLVLIYFRIFLH